MNTKTIKPSKRKLAQALAIAVLALAANQAQATDYNFSDLGTFPGGANVGINALGVNNLGQVAGVGSTFGYRWDGNTATPLDNLPGGVSGIAIGINDSGQIAGYNMLPPEVDGETGIRWEGTSAIPLDNLGFGYVTEGIGINSQGQIVGASWAGTSIHPVRWDNTAAIDLGTLGGSSGVAWGINDAGQAVGNSNTTNDDANHATLWNGASTIDLGTLGGTNSNAYSINNAGQIVGDSLLADDTTTHAVLWDGLTAAPIDLGSLGLNSSAQAINNAGQIVGSSTLADGSSHATFWDGQNIIDLNNYLPGDLAALGWFLSNGFDISDNGIITGGAQNGLNPDTAIYASFKLTPTTVPVPGAVWLFGSGLAGLIGATRRKLVSTV